MMIYVFSGTFAQTESSNTLRDTEDKRANKNDECIAPSRTRTRYKSSGRARFKTLISA